jgi:hypothetical protein
VKRILWGLAAALLASVLLDLVLPGGEYEGLPWWHTTTGFWAIFGLAGCIALVAIAKTAGNLGLKGPEPDPDQEAAAPLDPADPPDPPVSPDPPQGGGA